MWRAKRATMREVRAAARTFASELLGVMVVRSKPTVTLTLHGVASDRFVVGALVDSDERGELSRTP